MRESVQISTSRIEAFSDGVIAIIITVMVFDLKFEYLPNEHTIWIELRKLYPKFVSYLLSFTTLAIMWVNHHQLFHQIRHTDRRLLWYSVHLLFWMSLIPFATHAIGTNPVLELACFLYGVTFFMCATSFAMLRNYAIKGNLLLDSVTDRSQRKIQKKNLLAQTIYLSAAILSVISVYISLVLFLIVPVMYFIPEKIIHTHSNTK